VTSWSRHTRRYKFRVQSYLFLFIRKCSTRNYVVFVESLAHSLNVFLPKLSVTNTRSLCLSACLLEMSFTVPQTSTVNLKHFLQSKVMDVCGNHFRSCYVHKLPICYALTIYICLETSTCLFYLFQIHELQLTELEKAWNSLWRSLIFTNFISEYCVSYNLIIVMILCPLGNKNTPQNC